MALQCNFVYGCASCNLQWPVVTLCATRFNMPKFCVLPAQYICVYYTYFWTNGNYFLVQH